MFVLLAIFFGLASMLSYGFTNAFSQPLARSIGPAQMLFLRGFTVSLVLAAAAVLDWSHPHSLVAVLATIGLGIAGYLPVLAFSHGIRISRLGVVSPIAGASPLFTVLLSFLFLGASIKSLQWIAIVMVVLANVLVSIDLKNWRQSNVLQRSSGVPYALIAAIGWGLFYFFLVYATRALGPWLSAFWVEVGVTLAAGLHIWLSHLPVDFRNAGKPSVIMNGILICAGTAAFTVGVSHYNIGIVAALGNSTALVSAILGLYLFHERLNRREIAAGAMMILGVAVIALA